MTKETHNIAVQHNCTRRVLWTDITWYEFIRKSDIVYVQKICICTCYHAWVDGNIK